MSRISTISARSIRHGIYLGRGVVVVQDGVVWQRLFERAFVRTRVRFAKSRVTPDRIDLYQRRYDMPGAKALRAADYLVMIDKYKRGDR